MQVFFILDMLAITEHTTVIWDSNVYVLFDIVLLDGSNIISSIDHMI